MQNISIERYDHESITSEWSGLIEGTREDGSTWIMFLDAAGSPGLYWPRRDEGGGVMGDPVVLDTESDSTAGYLA